MAKLDEITELLTDELEGLRRMLVKLETLSKELTGSETVQDISAIKKELKDLNGSQGDHFQDQFDINYFFIHFGLFGLPGGTVRRR